MKKHILLIAVLFVSLFSYAQYDFLRASLRNIGSAPSYLVVKVKSPSYEGEAALESWRFMGYYETIKYDSLHQNDDYMTIWLEKDWELAYQDIKQGNYFIISDEDFVQKFGVHQSYLFEKIILSNKVLNNAKKGIKFFIRKYFNNKGIFNSPSSFKPSDFYTILKVMFDAGIMTGIGSEWAYFYIQDHRFYKDGKFVIPPEYRNN